MTYDILKKSLGKTAVQFVELYMEGCSRSYGVAPCAAAIGTTGTDRCLNTRFTCQAPAHFNANTKLYRFATTRMDNLQGAGDCPTFPTLLSCDSAPTILTPGQGLGVRSSVSLSIQDHPWTDVWTDPYRSLRAYNPDNQGTFWGKFAARHRYYPNRILKVYSGFLNVDGSYDAANFQVRTYVITKIAGPNPNGVVTIEGVDPLRLADGEKAKWPLACTTTLVANITELTTTFDVHDPTAGFNPADPTNPIVSWWNGISITPTAHAPIAFASGRFLRFEDEVIHVTALTSTVNGDGTGTWHVTCTRGTMPTWYDFSQDIAVPHSAGATVQVCWQFDHLMVYDILLFLLSYVAKVDTLVPGVLPYNDWKAHFDTKFPNYDYATLLVNPMAVKDLLAEITQLGVLIFWHERRSEVVAKGLQFTQLLGPQINDQQSIIKESVGTQDDPTLLMTEHWLYFDMSWPLANMDLWQTYRVVDVTANTERELPEEFGTPYIKQVKCRWLERSQVGLAKDIGSTQILQYEDLRKILTWSMDPKDDSFWVGDTVGVSTKYLQDQYGNIATKNFLVTQVKENYTQGGLSLTYTGMELFNFQRTGLISHPDHTGSDPDPGPGVYSSATDANKNHYAFICYNSGHFLDGTPAYQLT